MITAVDTSVLIDVLIVDPRHAESSEAALRRVAEEGKLVVCDVVYAELAGAFSEHARLDAFLDGVGIERDIMAADSLFLAGVAWRAYVRNRGPITCPSCGESLAWRQHLVSDFFIGAHAMSRADRLLTRDRGFYRTYFSGLILIEA